MKKKEQANGNRAKIIIDLAHTHACTHAQTHATLYRGEDVSPSWNRFECLLSGGAKGGGSVYDRH